MLAVHELVLWFKVGFENAAACVKSVAEASDVSLR